MENYTDTIDLINAYINNTLSKAERLAFKNRLQTDLEFNSLYNEHLTILEGIKRADLINEIQAAKQNYVRTKWMKYIGVSVGVVLLSALIYTFSFKTETPQIVEPTNTNEIEIVSDSVVVEKTSEDRVETETTIVEQAEAKEVVKENDEIVTSQKTTHNDNSNKSQPIVENHTVEVVEEEPESVKSEPTTPELKAFFKSVKKAPQIIEVNTEQDFTFTCKEGTKLTIPAKAFVEVKTGKLARGKINLEVTEYYKLSDMLLANLTTKSNDKQLETGGMLYLDANKKGKKLKLKSGKRIKMAFVNKGKKNMQLFTGVKNSEGVNWKLEKQVKYIHQKDSVRTIENEIIEEDVEVSFSVIEEVPIYPGCENEKSNVARGKCMSDAMKKIVEREFDTSIAEDLGLTGLQKINAFFEIGKDGVIGKIRVTAPRKELGDEAVRVIKSMPKLKPGRQRGRAVSTTYFLPFRITLEGATINQAPITVRSDRALIGVFENRLDSTKSVVVGAPITTSEIANYAFATSKLGWINCDRFARTTSKKVKYKLKIKDSEGVNVKMVFKSMSSILPSTKRNENYDFGWVPKDEEVVLIAIKKKDDKLFLGKKEIQTSRILQQNIDFKEITIKELTNELQKLNNSFN